MEIINNQILLSICIPTYCRAKYLKLTIDSIVSQERFLRSYDVEIVISDNCSTDDTETVVQEYLNKFGDKIKYSRNEENIGDKNFPLVLSKGNGLFLKLNNDTLKHLPGSLDLMLESILLNIDTDRILFFQNQKNKIPFLIVKGLSEFIEKASFQSTSIASFGTWKADFTQMQDFNRYSKLQLIQTDVLFRLITKKKEVYINNQVIFDITAIEKKGGYDIITVFLDNYTFILREQIEKKNISEDVYRLETKRLLLNFFAEWFANLAVYPEKFYFETKNRFPRILRFYRDRPLLIILFYVIYFKISILRFGKKVYTGMKVNI